MKDRDEDSQEIILVNDSSQDDIVDVIRNLYIGICTYYLD